MECSGRDRGVSFRSVFPAGSEGCLYPRQSPFCEQGTTWPQLGTASLKELCGGGQGSGMWQARAGSHLSCSRGLGCGQHTGEAQHHACWGAAWKVGLPAAFLEEMHLWAQATCCQWSPGLWQQPHHAGGGTEAGHGWGNREDRGTQLDVMLVCLS